MEILEFLRIFLDSETPFMLLFVSLFFYNVKAGKDREAIQNKLIEEHLSRVEEELTILIKVWKILLEKELGDRE
jgi:hypothetical protein